MTYQVLARKYRPRTFSELVGQEHVSRALTHALENDRLHHAYLFTGTRGVGKTTIARILSRCLNCEEGVSATPCGVCPTCLEIGEGRYVDLIEVDAASRTKVEDTRELLDNVQYAPTRGRYKVYLIDEVHMLSAHSFNALLKTLEEPPPHVKFLLATTDPQKLPVTVLSRCLQFSLKALPGAQIAEHLRTLLDKEQIGADDAALQMLGDAAQGSMRDALSLTDQAIAYCGAALNASDVRNMLGTVDLQQVQHLLEPLVEENLPALFSQLDAAFAQRPDALALLDALLGLLHELAICQAVPERGEETLKALASQFSAEQVQLFYDIGLRGRRDLPDAPDQRAALEMVLLRMAVFSPKGGASNTPLPAQKAPLTAEHSQHVTPATANVSPPAAPPQTAPLSDLQSSLAATSKPPERVAAPEPQRAAPQDRHEDDQPPWDRADKPASAISDTTVENAAEPSVVAPTSPPAAQSLNGHVQPITAPAAGESLGEWWASLLEKLDLHGPSMNLARHSQLIEQGERLWHLRVDTGHQVLVNEARVASIGDAISTFLGRPVRVEISFDRVDSDTPEALAEEARQARYQAARETIHQDAVINELVNVFSARIDEDSIRPNQE